MINPTGTHLPGHAPKELERGLDGAYHAVYVGQDLFDCPRPSGTGDGGRAATRVTGASRYSKAASCTAAAISTLGPANFGASSSTMTCPVFRAEVVIVSRSRGARVRTSITSADTPEPARASAACNAPANAAP